MKVYYHDTICMSIIIVYIASCKENEYSPTGYIPCSPCVTGYHQPAQRQTYCARCESNSTTEYCSRGNICKTWLYTTSFLNNNIITVLWCNQFIACQVNEYSNTGFSPCSSCPPGYYQPSIGQTSCTACEVDSTNEYCISAGTCIIAQQS